MMKKQRRNKHYLNESGYSLVGVLLLVVLISVLGLGLLTVTTTSVQTTTSERSDQSAFYIAEAGATVKMAEIEEIVAEEVQEFEKTKDQKDENDISSKIYHFYDVLTDRLIESKKSTEEYGLNFEETFGKPAEFDVSTNEDGDVQINSKELKGSKQFKIISTGAIGNQKRTVEQVFTVEYVPAKGGSGDGGGGGGDDNTGGPQIVPCMAAYVNDTIRMTDGAYIKGDFTNDEDKCGVQAGSIGTRKAGAGSITVSGGPTIEGSIYVPPGSEGNALTGDSETIRKLPKPAGKDMGELPKLPDFPPIPENYMIPPNKEVQKDGNKHLVIDSGNILVTHYAANNYVLEMENHIKLDKIEVNSDRKLYIDTKKSNKEIVVKDLNITNGHIFIKGEGKLTIYVENSITMGSGSSINKDGEVKQLNVFLKGSHDPKNPKTLKLGGDQKIFGSLYAEDANIEFGAGGGFQGNLLTGGKSIKLSGGSRTTSALVLAPNANVELSEGGMVTGAVIAQSLNMKGGAGITYKKIKLPIFGGPGDNSDSDEGKVEDPDLDPGEGRNKGSFKVTKKALREQSPR
ncbi:hypothetical protein QNH23_00040 [Siminovitchia fortis]|uniref:Type 4 fimbrial biogenesis protein PilX N-terminal domain-containing protein n=1 Tax=Siminovitchia fortis TaxID=254758 RepID=A0A443IUW2_9BACI|nr:PilX N-terminal domain-containing pilus assembly protein [Siminovitchia fortis]RWR11861.1 hypothetical protein D4N35_007945 [Siminovitchia fortis]WHY81859.1 hypothetical protein QNH23_00040 [Siminovitchia fortis]